MSTKNQKILYAIKNNPLLIGSLLKDTSINKGMIYRELNKAIPCRIGIEFELSGNFRKKFVEEYKTSIKSIDKTITHFYNVYSIDTDDLYLSEKDIYEVRISILNFKQLKGLYKFMQDLPKFCKLHEGGGIHIHVDISEYFPLNDNKEKDVKKYIERHLQEIISIFPKYTGKYNQRKVGIRKKATYLNISNKRSLEFRIAPLSFDYSTVINWVIQCVKFRNKVIHYCRLKKSPTPINNLNNINHTICDTTITGTNVNNIISNELDTIPAYTGYEAFEVISNNGDIILCRNASDTST